MKDIMPHWLAKRAFLSPDQIAIELHNKEKITFFELNEASESFARKLARIGVRKGDKVGLFSSNHTDMIIAIHALSYIGAVVVLLNTRLTKSEITFQVKDAEVSTIISSDNFYQDLIHMKLPVPIKNYTEVSKGKEKNISLMSEINLEDPFTIVYTSGTTGSPKGVVHTYGNHWWSAIGSALNLGLSERDKWLAVLPLFHVGGFSICMRSVIYGIPVFLLEKFDEEIVNDAILNRGVTIASVVTVMLQRLKENLGGKKYPKSFRCMLLGGGPVPEPLLEEAVRKNIPVFQSYGLTETSSQIVTLSPRDSLKKLGSAGKPLFPGQLIIHHPGEDGVGEIFVKGPMVAKGYYNNPEANKRAFSKGYLATGDLGYLDQEGFLYVVDRRTDLIISGGENIYPSEIESVLSGHAGIKEVAVVGEQDEYWGEVPVAFVVAKDENLTDGMIKKYAKEHLAKYKVPKRIYFKKELPRTASNKLMKKELKLELNRVNK